MHNIIKSCLVAICGLGLLSLSAFAVASNVKPSADPVVGIWWTQDHNGGIELYSCGSKICGRFYWLRDDVPEDVSLDEHNPDTGKRGKPLCMMQFMGDFEPDGTGHYTDGWIYSPRSGWTYSAQMTLDGHNKLDLHGYVLTPLLGESQIWTRAGTIAPCVTG